MALWLRIIIALVIWMVVALIAVAILQVKGSPYFGPPAILGTLAAGLFLVFAKGPTNSKSTLSTTASSVQASKKAKPQSMPASSGSDSMNLDTEMSTRASMNNGHPPEWSEEFKVLYEYDTVVKECHDEIEGIGQNLSRQLREEVVLDRKKATEIRDRLLAEHNKQKNPYQSNELNDALAQARLLGKEAESEFLQVIKVMGEDTDTDTDLIINRLSEKYDLRSNLHLLKSIVEEPHGGGVSVIDPNGNAYLRRFKTAEEAYEFMCEMKHPELNR